MKKHSVLIKALIIITIFVPIMIFALSKFVDENTLKELYEHTFERIGISQKSTIWNSIANKKLGDSEHFSIGETGDYTWGSFEVVYENWANPYTVTQDQYGYYSPLVGYCCYLGWPTIKSADASYMEDVDEAGGDHDYPSWAAYAGRLALANHNGHKQRIECEKEATFGNLNKAIAYTESGLNGDYSNGDIQNLVWNSAVWQTYFQGTNGIIDLGVVEGNLGSATQIDTIGNVSYHYQGDSVAERLVRAQQFATWAYQVLANDGFLDLKLTPGKENEKEDDDSKKLHVEADQATLSYLVGPFKLDLIPSEGSDTIINDNITAAGTGNQTLGDFLYKEITMQNATQTSNNTFIKTRFMIHAEYENGYSEDIEVKRNADGTIAKQEESAKTNERVVITDENGVAFEYGMPEFGKQFYIKYYLTADLALNHNLKYIQPEIKAEYLNDSMTAGGTKEKSVKVSYSIHYSLCNEENDAVNSFVKNAGYENMDLGDSSRGGSLLEAFFYSNDRGKTANVQDGIDALVDMVASSNQGGDATVTWYDDSWGGWDDKEQFFAAYWGYDRAGRCDGVFLDECDTTFYHGGYAASGHENFSFASEFDTVDAYWNCLKSNYVMYVDARSDENGSANGDIIKYYAEKMAVSTNNGEEFSADWIRSPEKFSSTNCGCDENETCPGENDSCCGNDACDDCDCYEPAEYCDCDDGEDSSCECSPCDCYEPAVECSCGCSCKYKYCEVELAFAKTFYYRDYVGGDTQQTIKIIGTEIREDNTVTIPASGYIYDTADEAIDALVDEINKEIKKVLEEREQELHDWYYAHAWPALYVPYGLEDWPYTLPFVEERQEMMQKVIYNIHAEKSSSWVGSDYLLTKKEINEYLGGNVSENNKGIEDKDDYQVKNVWQGSGIEVALIDLGIMASSPKPTPPVKPDPVYDVPKIPKPEEPKEPEPPTPPNPPGPQVFDSEQQAGGQCAMYAIANTLRSAGVNVTAEEVLNWMVEKGYYRFSGPSYDDPNDYYYPSRWSCIDFANEYIKDHPSSGTTNLNVHAFYNEAAGSYYLDENYIISHLPENVNGENVYEEGKTYSSLQICYFGQNNPGINSASNSHYVNFNSYRYNNGKLEVYCVNSGQGFTSGWIEWDLIDGIQWRDGKGQSSAGPVDRYSADDWGAIEITYQMSWTEEAAPIDDSEYQEQYAAYLIAKADYDVKKAQYDKDYQEWEKNQEAIKEYQVNKEAYDIAMDKWREDMDKYQDQLEKWQETTALLGKEEVVQITITDKNGNYGFQRLNPLHKYRLQFRYDGLEYIVDKDNPTEDDAITDISDDIQNRLTAYEMKINNGSIRSEAKGREEVNQYFAYINASNMNYKGTNGYNKAYGWYTKLRKNDASFIDYNDYNLEPNAPKDGGTTDDNNVGALRFVDAYDLFKQEAIKRAPEINQEDIKQIVKTYVNIEEDDDITYEDIIQDSLPEILTKEQVGTSVNENNEEYADNIRVYDEAKRVSDFIYDSLVTAETKEHFPDKNPVKFFLEDVGTGRNDDANNRKEENKDTHPNCDLSEHKIVDDPFPVLEGSKPQRLINGLYNQKNSGDEQTIRNRDQARNVDFTFKRREEANLAIAMDLTQVTLTINGQKEIYKYGDLGVSKDDKDKIKELSRISNRAKDEDPYKLVNYKKNYSRVITESMYLYDGKLVDKEGGDVRDLSMYITYKIVIMNTGKVDMNVGYIVDHYDSYYQQWKEEDQGKIQTIVGAENCTARVLGPTGDSTEVPSHPYDSDKKKLDAADIPNMYNEVFIKVGKLAPNDTEEYTITFEQRKDDYGRIRVNQDLNTGELLVGDKNVVEIDDYSTADNDVFTKGLITRLSNIGNLCPVDFYGMADQKKAGGLIVDDPAPVINRVEVDTACAPNLVIYIPTEKYIPCISGNTFEDVRSQESDKALIGNGEYKESDTDLKKIDSDGDGKQDDDDNDKKIKGVTVQLVELVREVDAYGLTSGGTDNYIKEKIWGTTVFAIDGQPMDIRRATTEATYVPKDYTEGLEEHKRYYSGSGKSQIIMDVNSGYLKIADSDKKDDKEQLYKDTNEEEGEYKFVNVPPGVFVIRFMYGDTTQTVLVKGPTTNEVNSLLQATTAEGSPEDEISYEDPNANDYMFIKNNVGYIGTEGLNSKSYNGNDYKSTVYQAELSQDTEYPGEEIYGFKNYNIQNFTNNDGISMTQIDDADLLNKLYYYDIAIGDSKEHVSDAKDIYAFRQNSDNYAKGYISALHEENLYLDHQIAQLETFNQSTYTTEEFEIFGYTPDGHPIYKPKYGVDNAMSGSVGENPITLRNYRNEIMNSFEEIGTYTNQNTRPLKVEDNEAYLDANRQVAMIKELMKYTRMVAQSGVINFEIEYTEERWADTYDEFNTEYIEQEQLYNGTPEANNLPTDDYIKDNSPREKHFHIRNLNLGLVQRPEAQIRLNKNAANVKIALSSGETLFDTSKSVNNLYFAIHKNHTYKINSKRLQSVQVTTNSLTTPELIQAYMDDELIENATLEVKYIYTLENIGEVDYLDKKFYYTGKSEKPNDITNVSRTNLDEVLDYVPNNINFNAESSNNLDEIRVKNVDETILNDGYAKSNWQVKAIIPEGGKAGDIVDSKDYYSRYIYPFGVTERDAQREQTPIGSTPGTLSNEYLWGAGYADNLNADLVNREFFDRVNSYDTIITTDRLSTKKYKTNNYYSIQTSNGSAYTYGLLPKTYNVNKEEYYKIETPVLLSVVMSQNDDLVFPNLVEAVRISNSVGRRCTFSTVGNQPMANQHSGIDVSSEETKDTLLDKYSTYNPVDVVTPIEVDADSSQNVRILPPTGFNKNNSNLYFALIGALSIILVSIFMIKVGLGQRRNRRNSDISRWK